MVGYYTKPMAVYYVLYVLLSIILLFIIRYYVLSITALSYLVYTGTGTCTVQSSGRTSVYCNTFRLPGGMFLAIETGFVRGVSIGRRRPTESADELVDAHDLVCTCAYVPRATVLLYAVNANSCQ